MELYICPLLSINNRTDCFVHIQALFFSKKSLLCLPNIFSMQKLVLTLLITGVLSATNTVQAGRCSKVDSTSHAVPSRFSIDAPAGNKLYYRPLFDGKHQRKLDGLTSKGWFKMTHIAVPLMVSGVAFEWAKQPINDLRNAYIPTFRYKYDDYLQYAPAALMLGLKIGGVKSYSSWGRMLTADAFSVAIMATLVNGLKYTVKSPRPNSGSHNSFPSGHTATAFMAATMLHKEYGMRSPWYSVAGYTLATATAYSRLLNNRHWISDVLAGAGIGILSTELGYWLAGLIFKDKGIEYDKYDYDTTFPDRTPSFIGLYTGYVFMAHEIRLSDGLVFHTSPGASSGVEGAWFINNYVGVGGKAVASHVPTQLQRDASLASYLTNPNTAITENGIDFISASVGAYFDCALTYRLSLGGKLLAGYAFSDAQTIYLTPDNGETVTPFLKLKEMHAPDFQTGLSISYWAKLKLGFRLFFDYSITPTRYRYYFADKPDAINRVNKNLSFFTLGASINLLL